MLSRSFGPLLLAAVLACSACDSVPGPTSFEGEPPVVSNFSFDPHEVGSLAGQDDVVTFPLNVEVTVTDADGDLAEVSFAVHSPSAGEEVIAQGTLTATADNRFEETADISIPKGEVGVYTVRVFAVDEEGTLSNSVLGNLRFVGTGEPPVIEDVEADPEVVRPPDLLRLVAIVSDPDGLGNIARVVGTTPNGSEFDLVDDGTNLGDETAGDGRYTATFDVPSATPGTQTFTFVAIDKSGLQSDVFTKDIVIE